MMKQACNETSTPSCKQARPRLIAVEEIIDIYSSEEEFTHMLAMKVIQVIKKG